MTVSGLILMSYWSSKKAILTVPTASIMRCARQPYQLFWMFVLTQQISVLADGETTGEVCSREPGDMDVAKTPGDNGFRIKISGRPQPEKYTPAQVYTGDNSSSIYIVLARLFAIFAVLNNQLYGCRLISNYCRFFFISLSNTFVNLW